MLMMIGPVRFQVFPVNLTDYRQSREASFVEKPVVGARPPLEWVGEGPETISLRARLFPQKFGGRGGLAALNAARASGAPQYMMRGDGGLMGWVVIERVTERSSYLDADGVGKVIDVDIVVKRTGGPTAGLFFSFMSAVFS